MTDRRTPWNSASTHPDHAPPIGLPDALVAEHNRMRNARATAARGLTQRRWRRRVLPPLAVTSAVLLGTGTAGAWVNAELTAKNTAPAPVDTSGQLVALEQVRQQLSADELALAAMTAAARSARPQPASSLAAAAVTLAPAPSGTPAPLAVRRPTSTTVAPKPAVHQRVVAPTAVARPSTATAPAPIAAPTPSIAAPAPVQVVAPPTQAPAPAPPPPPPVHATTGASGAKP